MSPLREHLFWIRPRRPCSFLPWRLLNGFRSSKPCHSLCHSRVRTWFCFTTRSSVLRRSLLPILYPVQSLFRLFRTLLVTCPRGSSALSEQLSFLGKLLGQPPLFSPDCLSLHGIGNMPCHFTFDSSLLTAVPCLPHVHLGLMTFVALPRHSITTVISLSNLMQVATWKSNRVFASRYLKEVSATQDNIRQFGPLVIAGDRLHPRPPQHKH